MTTAAPQYVDVRTGEVTPAEVVEQIARDFAAVTDARDAALAEARRLGVEWDALAADLRAIVPAEGVVDIGPRYVAMVPSDPPARRVDRNACERFREELLGLGLGRESLDYHAPTAKEVREEKARIVAAGIPLGAILPDPVCGPPIPKVVPKGAS